MATLLPSLVQLKSSPDDAFLWFLSLTLCVYTLCVCACVSAVDCNDSLYASDPKFIAELAALVDSVLDVLVDTVESYTEPGVVRA